MRLASDDLTKQHPSRVLYWWRPPVESERSAEAGARMLAIVGYWFVSVIVMTMVVGIVLNVTA